MRSVKSGGRTNVAAGEADLIHKARAGDSGAYGQLYDTHVEKIYRYIFFRVADVQTAEDLTSGVFLKAWESIGRYRPGAPFLAWLYTIARNTVIDHYRTHKPQVRLESVVIRQDSGLEERLERHGDAAELRLAMQHLTDEQQEVLRLRFIEELDTEEIASRMDKTPGAIRALQMRALQAAARHIDADMRSDE